MKKLKITSITSNSLFTLIDDEDYERCSRYTWYLHKSTHDNYVRGVVDSKLVYLHKFLLNEYELDVDHKNGNGLDNQRDNLRRASKSNNMCNISLRSDSTSGFKGVSYDKTRGTYRAYITYKGKTRNLGRFYSAERAAQEYNIAAMRYHGEFAVLNEVINV